VIESFGQMDYITIKPFPRHCEAIVIVDGALGHAPYISTSSFIGDKKPIGYFMSRFMAQEPINTVPDMEQPGWPVHQIADNLIVVTMRHFHTPDSTGLTPTTLWAYYYPVLMGLARFLSSRTEGIHVFNVTSAHDCVPDNLFKQLSADEVQRWQFYRDDEPKCEDAGDPLFCLAPAWFLNWSAAKTAPKNNFRSTLVNVGYEPASRQDGLPVAVDLTATNTLIAYIEDYFGVVHDAKALDAMITEIELSDMESRQVLNEVHRAVAQLDKDKGKNPNGVMFG